MAYNNNYCIILAGGIGRRLWPVSREKLPKQFVDFLGTNRTLLQQTFDRYRKIVPTDHIIISTHVTYKDIVLEQLPELNENQLILEPMRRNTAPSIYWACSLIQQKNANANIIVAPTDHVILKEDEFCKAINNGLEFIDRHPYLLTLGIKPNSPVTEYGYIQLTDEKEDRFIKVKTFVEKPQLEFAKIFVDSGEFYWNSGIFLWNVDTAMRAFAKYMPEICTKLSNGIEEFSTCPNISIDYAVMEKADNVYVQLCDFGWADLGTWELMYQHHDKDKHQNVTLSGETMLYDCENNIITAPKDNIIIAQGLKDYLIAVKDKVILICKKDDNAAIRKFYNELQMKSGEKYI